MGCFDTIRMTCPHCNSITEEQTKVGDCELKTYTLGDNRAPLLTAAMHGPQVCAHCHGEFLVQVSVSVQVVPLTPEDADNLSYEDDQRLKRAREWARFKTNKAAEDY